MSSNIALAALPDVTSLVHSPFVSIGERVEEARKARGLKMNELDRIIGQGSGYTTRLASGQKKRPDPQILAKISEALGVSYEWLVTGVGPGPDRSAAPTKSAPATVVESPDRYPIVTEFVSKMRRYGATDEEVALFRARVSMYKSADGPTVEDLASTLLKMQNEGADMDARLSKIYQRAPVKDDDLFGPPRGGASRSGAKGRR